jgi:hypothetical protein
MKNVRDSENESLKSKEIKKSIWMNPPKKWLSIADVLSKKIVFKINDAVCQLVDCIDDEYEKILYDVDQKELCIKIPPIPDYDDIFHSKKTFEAQKFLVRLSREKIISNLYLPSSIRFEKTKGTVIVQVRFNAFFLDDKFAFWYALLKPEQLNEEIISFKIIDWESLSKAIEGIKKSKEYKRYKRNKALKDREEKNHKFAIIKTKKDLQREDKKEVFEVMVKDRQIWINNYLLSKPHATGINLEFFEYVQRQPFNTKIERNKLPDFGGLALKQEVKDTPFIKILNKLGFKDEILKAYFYKRSKDSFFYRGNKITKEDIEKAGVRISVFIKELELAHAINNPD